MVRLVNQSKTTISFCKIHVECMSQRWDHGALLEYNRYWCHKVNCKSEVTMLLWVCPSHTRHKPFRKTAKLDLCSDYDSVFPEHTLVFQIWS